MRERDGLTRRNHGAAGPAPEHPGLARFRRVVEVCDAFEAAWGAGASPTPERWADLMPREDRAALLPELIGLEVELRRAAGEGPTPGEYHARLPDDGTAVAAAFAAAAGPNAPPPAETLEGIPRRRASDRGEVPSLGWVKRYELLERIGGGGMGVVYRAYQHDARRMVALKFIRSDLDAPSGMVGPEAVERFRNEAQAMARLNHPNVVTVHDVGEWEGRPYYAMEYVEGKSLAEHLVAGPIEGRRAAGYLEPVARAVHRAHGLSLLHRDIKPGNVLIDRDGRPLVADFGLVKLLDDAPHLALTSGPLGTPGYMSPEQARGSADLGPASDVYNLGATLYEALTGRPPFRAATVYETLRQVIEEAPAHARALNPAVSLDLDTICEKCLRKDPARRYPTAEALADDLGRSCRGEPIEARPVGAATRAWLWARRNPRVAALSALVYLLTAVVAVGAVVGFTRINAALGDARRQLVRQYLTRGLALAATPRSSAALPWLAEAVRLEEASGADAGLAAARLAAHLRQAPVPDRVWAHGRPIAAFRRSPDGRNVATLAGREVCLWDVAGDRPEAPAARLPLPAEGVCLALRPDGGALAVAAADGTVSCFDVAARRLTGTLPAAAGTGPACDLAYSPDGRRLAVAGPGGTVRVWDAGTLSPQRGPLGHPDVVNDLDFSPDGHTLAVAYGGPALAVGGVTLWGLDGAAGPPPPPRDLCHEDDVYKVAFSPDGRLLMTAGFVRKARLWEVATGKDLGSWSLGAIATDVAFSPDGRHAGVVAGRDLHLIGLDGETTPPPLRHGGDILAFAFSGDGRRVATAGDDRTAVVWDVAGGGRLGPALPHNGRVTAVAFGPEGRTLWTAAADRTARAWDLARGQGPELTLWLSREKRYSMTRTAFSRDGRRILTVSRLGLARLWDGETGRPLGPIIDFAAETLASAFHPDGRLVATLDAAGRARVWHAESGALAYEPPVGDGVATSVVFSGDGAAILTGEQSPPGEAPSGTARLYDARTGAPRGGPFRHPGPFLRAAVDASGRRVATYGPDGLVRVWDARTGRPDGPGFRHPGGLWRFDFAPDGRTAATASEDGTARLWDVATGRPLGTPLRHEQGIRSVAFSPDGLRVATASFDRTAQVWGARTGAPLAPPLEHEGEVYVVAFSPDGRLLATGSGGGIAGGQGHGQAALWDARTGDPVGPPFLHGKAVDGLSFRADGRRLITQSFREPTALVWEVPAADADTAALRSLAALVAGQEADPGGGVAALTPGRLAEACRRARAAGGGPAADRLAWHAREAESCEAWRQWADADGHLSALLAAGPDRPDLLARRGHARGELGRAADASADFEAALAAGSEDSTAWYCALLLRAARGDLAGYHAGCAELTRRFAAADDPHILNNFAEACAIAPGAPDALGRSLLRMDPARVGVGATDWALSTRGAVLYRAGAYAEALDSLRRAGALGTGDEGPARALAALALARLGRVAEAREVFDRLGRAPAKAPLPRYDRTHRDLLLAEARPLLAGVATPSP